MWTVRQAMQRLVEELEIPPARRKTVTRQHEVVRAILRQALAPPEDFISGSYGRGTAVHPLHDVDLFVVLNPQRHPRGSRTTDETLKQIRQVFKEEWTERELPRLQSHSVGIDFSSNIHIDIVPAYQHEQTGYLIPQRGTGAWILTNPKRHQAVAAEADAAAGHQLNRLIKLVKHWNRQQQSSPLRSFHLEAMCYQALSRPPTGTLLEQLGDVFEFLSKRVMYPCGDPAGLGGNVDAGFEKGQREAAHQLLLSASRTVRHVNEVSEVSGCDHSGPHAQLRKLLGDRYRTREP
ncbi:nucleotidyltransferase domain-containing protein [Myxococcus landrumensis]|uniref:Nucleotidyltransferase n=1 Tax=Myxococcus landrumensis TaxID=2813577 RepID=A0ABX7N0M3_9BACT|nr:nucleotidyltransferase [Myxococcus landrumus]QSQ12138.1 nucleotidyltransferase [Myxococcus landrumus]